jgi:hypothetical protein
MVMTTLFAAVHDRLRDYKGPDDLTPDEQEKIRARVAVEESTLDPYCRLLYLVLSRLPRGNSWPMRELASRTGMGESTVRGKVKILEAEGWLTTKRDPRYDTLRFWTEVPWEAIVPDQATYSARMQRGRRSLLAEGPPATGGESAEDRREHLEEHYEEEDHRPRSSTEAERLRSAAGFASDGIKLSEKLGLSIEPPALRGTWLAAGFITRVLRGDFQLQAETILGDICPDISTGDFRAWMFDSLGMYWEPDTCGAIHVISTWGRQKGWEDLDIEFEGRVLQDLIDGDWGYELEFGVNDPHGRTDDLVEDWLNEIGERV